jgi:ribosomal protein S18 acetylase RimI-like enzyme
MSRAFVFPVRAATRRVQIRPADWSDIEGMARVTVDTWAITYAQILPPAYLARMRYASQEHQRSRLMHAAGVHHLVAVEPTAGEVVGYASCGPNRNDGAGVSGEIYELYVQNGFQGRGIGRRLFRAARNHLASDGHETMIVWVLSANPNLGVYPRLGGWLHGKKTIRVGGASVEETGYTWRLDKA